MPKTNTIKQQRDRFLAFAFACADLFLEISETGEIVFATGAAKGMTGIDDQALIGKNWLELFENNHTPALTSMKDSAKPAMRCGPLFVTLNKKITDQQGIVTGIRMLPPDNHFYITLSLSRALMEKLAEIIQRSPELQPAAPAQAQARPPPPVTTDFTPEDEEFDDTIYNKQSFLDEADKTFEFAKTQNIDADVTVFDFGRTQTLPEEDWAGMMAEMAKYLRSQSLDNSAPGEIAPGYFSIIHEKGVESQNLIQGLSEIAKKFDPESKLPDIKGTTIAAGLDSAEVPDISRALLHTLNAIEDNEKIPNIDSLQNGQKALVNNNKNKQKAFENIIKSADFDLSFQPIVDIRTKAAVHYEILSRFKSGETLDWIAFGEDTGLISEFDLTVVERAMNFIHYKDGMTRRKFAINISVQSMNNPKFLDGLKEQLAKRDLANRLIFELSHTMKINEYKKTVFLIELLKSEGIEISMDHFELGAAAEELTELRLVNYLKLHSKYTKNILTSDSDKAELKAGLERIKDHKVTLIAQHVETQEQADALSEMGIRFAQGYLYAKPSKKPDYIPKR